MSSHRHSRARRQSVLGALVPVASTPWQRLIGLAFLDPGDAGPGLWFPRCRSIHTFGMRFDLEVVFIDAGGLPLRRIERLGPARLVICRRAFGVLERPAQGARAPESG